MFVVVADEVEGGSIGLAVVLRNAVGGMAGFMLENHAGPPGVSSRYAYVTESICAGGTGNAVSCPVTASGDT